MQKLAEICVRRPVFATMLIAALTVIGGVSFFQLGVDRYPRIDLPVSRWTTSRRRQSRDRGHRDRRPSHGRGSRLRSPRGQGPFIIATFVSDIDAARTWRPVAA
jgi:hypothetical protein